MSSETTLAFGHPELRAQATAPADMPDRISLRDHVVEVEIGAFQAERGVTQRLSFNIVVEVRPVPDTAADDVDLILSYDRVTEAIAAELAAERLNLLETLAERIAARILRQPQALRVFVRIEKLDRGPGKLGVEIVRQRRDEPTAQDSVTAAPRPRILFFCHEAITDGRPADWLDHFRDGPPLILCAGLPDAPRPRAATAEAQRHIDLLAIEQACWQLAARAPRCKVVATRTELDWSLRNGQVAIWAPSKLVLDAARALDETARPEDLALWLARELDAVEMVMIGGTPPASAEIPLRKVAARQSPR